MTLVWDTTIFNNRRLESNRPDITLVQKSPHERILTDFVLPWDKKIMMSEQVREMYQEAAAAIPFGVGTLGTIFRNISGQQDILGIVVINWECAGDNAAWNSSYTEENGVSLSYE